MEISSTKRIIQLDFLRAVAILLVIGNHSAVCPPEISYLLYKITGFWYQGGWVGVDLFFVLSGFLVSGLLFREYKEYKSLRLKRFLIRRGLKIYPSFYVMIAVTILLAPVFEKEILPKVVLSEVFFVQNFGFGRLWAHTWSLAVEEHFYFGLALLAFVLTRVKQFRENPFRLIPHFFLFFAVICFVLRALMAIYKGTSIGPTFFRIDSLFFGVMISYFWHFRALSENLFLKQNKILLIVLGIILFSPAFMFDSVVNPWFFVFGLTTNYIAGGCLLIGFLSLNFNSNVFTKIFSYIGKYSYSIYLWHLMIQEWIVNSLLNKFGIDNWFVYIFSYVLGAILIGAFLSKLIEFPVLKIRDKYFPNRTEHQTEKKVW